VLLIQMNQELSVIAVLLVAVCATFVTALQCNVGVTKDSLNKQECAVDGSCSKVKYMIGGLCVLRAASASNNNTATHVTKYTVSGKKRPRYFQLQLLHFLVEFKIFVPLET